MPTYEYRCKNCESEHDIFQSITENPKRKCPKCGRMKLERLISSGGGVIFKGSGFYETDYKRKSQPSGDTSDKETSGKESTEKKTTEKKSDSGKDK